WLRMSVAKGITEEVVNGHIRHIPAPSLKHAKIVRLVSRQFDLQADESKVLALASQFDLVIRRQPLTTRQPDLAVCLAETMVEKDGRLHSPPELIVEVVSPANTPRDRQEELADYASLRVPEVRFLFPERRNIQVLQLKNGSYDRIGIFADG